MKSWNTVYGGGRHQSFQITGILNLSPEAMAIRTTICYHFLLISTWSIARGKDILIEQKCHSQSNFTF